MSGTRGPSTRKGWLDRPSSATLLYRILIGVCALLIALDIGEVYHKHTHFSWEGIIGFHGLYGFVGFFLIVLSGWPLRRILSRKEDYYDE
jgi:hypothetical protein